MAGLVEGTPVMDDAADGFSMERIHARLASVGEQVAGARRSHLEARVNELRAPVEAAKLALDTVFDGLAAYVRGTYGANYTPNDPAVREERIVTLSLSDGGTMQSDHSDVAALSTVSLFEREDGFDVPATFGRADLADVARIGIRYTHAHDHPWDTEESDPPVELVYPRVPDLKDGPFSLATLDAAQEFIAAGERAQKLAPGIAQVLGITIEFEKAEPAPADPPVLDPADALVPTAIITGQSADGTPAPEVTGNGAGDEAEPEAENEDEEREADIDDAELDEGDHNESEDAEAESEDQEPEADDEGTEAQAESDDNGDGTQVDAGSPRTNADEDTVSLELPAGVPAQRGPADPVQAAMEVLFPIDPAGDGHNGPGAVDESDPGAAAAGVRFVAPEDLLGDAPAHRPELTHHTVD